VAAGGEVLVNEADLWPDTDGQFVTTHLMVNAQFLEEHPEEVEAVLRGSVQANQFIADSPDEAKQIAGDSVAELTETEVDPAVLDQAWGNLTFTNDPISASLEKDATDAAGVGLLEGLDGVNVLDIYDLTLLNEVSPTRASRRYRPMSVLTRNRPTTANTTAPSGVAVHIDGVSKKFGSGGHHTVALRDTTLDVREGEFLCLVGASGCGKSTLLNLVAGLDQPTTGAISTGGRKVAFMFQESTLVPVADAEPERGPGSEAEPCPAG
jgi:ABC-type multidrug transport system fused ATPase/permease subunit